MLLLCTRQPGRRLRLWAEREKKDSRSLPLFDRLLDDSVKPIFDDW